MACTTRQEILLSKLLEVSFECRISWHGINGLTRSVTYLLLPRRYFANEFPRRNQWQHILFFRFPSVAAILISGMAAVFLLWMPQHSIHAALRKDQQVGDALFHRKGCVRCHGADAAGTAKGPDLRTIGKRWNKAQIERQIVEGGYEMPPFQDALQQDEVKSLVAYLSTQRKLPKNQ